GRIAKEALDTGIKSLRVGINTLEINNICAQVIQKYGATPSFLNYDNGDGVYPFASCVCVNEELVHALPSKTKILKSGDIVTIDLGVFYNGFHTDLSYTKEIETKNQDYFLNVGKNSLRDAIKQAIVGNYIGDVSQAMQKAVEDANFTVSVDLVGHGIGKKLHEKPQVPCFGRKKSGEKLIEGMVLAIEVMYMKGKSGIKIGKDGFAYVTKDGSLSAQFEHTVIVQKDQPIILA
ncbi:type I methionyl aminopeptidase, partial [Patescibacteria group bacterium]|nr:type I methionyl aminopeptidase [Patescibacteria group bacterium]